jgi:hypothetical protein
VVLFASPGLSFPAILSVSFSLRPFEQLGLFSSSFYLIGLSGTSFGYVKLTSQEDGTFIWNDTHRFRYFSYLANSGNHVLTIPTVQSLPLFEKFEFPSEMPHLIPKRIGQRKVPF